MSIGSRRFSLLEAGPLLTRAVTSARVMLATVCVPVLRVGGGSTDLFWFD